MGALSGVKVLDIATLYPAPLLAAMLGDFGADVVKVEPPSGDPLRAVGTVPWAVAGRNKRSVVVDFDTDDGLDLLQQLIAVADVIVCNQPANLLERWRCTDAQIASCNPRAVIAHVSAFGASGPQADLAGNGSLAEAFVGLGIGTVPLGDTMAAMSGVIGVLTALYARDAREESKGRGHGPGQVVDVSMYESLLPLLAPAIGGLSTSSVRSRHEIVDTNDGRTIAIAATTDAQRARLRELVGGDDVASWAAAQSVAAALVALEGARVPAVVVNDIASLRVDPQVVARSSVVTVDGAAIPAPAPKLSSTPGAVRHLGPALGEHTAAVVTEWLRGGTA